MPEMPVTRGRSRFTVGDGADSCPFTVIFSVVSAVPAGSVQATAVEEMAGDETRGQLTEPVESCTVTEDGVIPGYPKLVPTIVMTLVPSVLYVLVACVTAVMVGTV
jgi:hypothetical protein